MPRTNSCITSFWEPGNLPSSSGETPVTPELPTLYPPPDFALLLEDGFTLLLEDEYEFLLEG